MDPRKLVDGVQCEHPGCMCHITHPCEGCGRKKGYIMSRLSDVPIISLDLETGGLIPGKHSVLSIGAVVVPIKQLIGGKDEIYEITDKNSFYAQLEWDTVTVDPRALQINKLDIANPPGRNGPISNNSLPASEGIHCFFEWLNRIQKGYGMPVSQLHALGVNVGSFDLPMLRPIWNYGWNRDWPFHYRSIDLNSLFFALSNIQNKPFGDIKQDITKIAWDKVRNELAVPQGMHHALADAWSNVYVWEECLRRFGGDCEVLC